MLKSFLRAALVVSVVVLARQAQGAVKVEERDIESLAADLAAGRTTSEELVRAYLRRIEAIDRHGPTLRAVLAVNPDALREARARDRERRAGRAFGPLHGIPIIIKDNIELAGPLPTTAGSLALARNVTGRDAALVTNLRAAGAIVLAKTNLSEWANFRANQSTSGWSAVGGLTRNPYALDRSACGSSSGTGSAVAASLAAVGVGTETDGSITCPAAMTGLVGLKPTAGLLPQQGIVPISHSQDTAGPMARSVRDAALLLNAMTSVPEACTRPDVKCRRVDYTGRLAKDALAGKRIGVMRYEDGTMPTLDPVYAEALHRLIDAGAVLVDVDNPWDKAIGEAEDVVLHAEFKADLDAYLAKAPAGVASRSLADLIAFNKRTPAELRWFGQDRFEKAQATAGLAEPGYREALEKGRRLAGPEGLGKVIAAERLDALVAPTTGPAWMIDLVNGDHYGGSFTTLPAVSGYPHLTVPMGQVEGLPVAISFIGMPGSDAALLGYGYAFEQRAKARKPPRYLRTVTPSS